MPLNKLRVEGLQNNRYNADGGTLCLMSSGHRGLKRLKKSAKANAGHVYLFVIQTFIEIPMYG